MIFQASKLKTPPIIALAVVMVASSCLAGPASTNAWQSIIFSSPSNTDDISSNLTLQPTGSPLSDLQIRLQMMQDAPPVANLASLPVPAAPAPPPSQMPRFRKSSDESLAWEFMTPAQILGVSPDQILKTQKSDENNDQPSLTPMERFLENRNPVSGVVSSPDNTPAFRNYGGNAQTNLLSSLFSSAFENFGSPDAPQNNDRPLASPAGTPAWSTSVGLSLPSAPDPVKQKEEMDRFMRLLNRNFNSASADTALSGETPATKTSATFSGLNSLEPLGSPIAAPFAPLSSVAGKPADVAPLPSITPQATAKPAAAPPAWAPQPAPWLSTTPRPFAVPQRKF